MSDLHDKKSDFTQRKIIAFFLFLTVGLFSVAICGKTAFFSNSVIADQFSSYSCTASFRANVTDYVKDSFYKNGISADNIENVITQEYAENIVSTFAAGEFKSRIGFDEDAVNDEVKKLVSDIKDEITLQAKAAGFSADKNTINTQADSIEAYINDQLTFAGESYVDSILNIGSLVSTVLLAVSVIFTAIFAAMIYFTGKRRYRSVRSIAMAVTAAGITDLFAAAIAAIIFSVKSVDIYPNFIRLAFDNYINTAITAVASCGGLLLLLSIVIAALGWKLKKNK